jgi:hypothetical protein
MTSQLVHIFLIFLYINISQTYRIFLRNFQFVLCQHILAISLPAFPFFIFGRNVRTGSENKFVHIYNIPSAAPFYVVKFTKPKKVNTSFLSVLGPFCRLPVQKMRQTVLPPTSLRHQVCNYWSTANAWHSSFPCLLTTYNMSHAHLKTLVNTDSWA